MRGNSASFLNCWPAAGGSSSPTTPPTPTPPPPSTDTTKRLPAAPPPPAPPPPPPPPSSPAAVSFSSSAPTPPPTSLGGAVLSAALPPTRAYTAGEPTAMNSFVAGGGNIFFLGEYGSGFGTEDDRINSVLSALGNPMSLAKTTFDSGFIT